MTTEQKTFNAVKTFAEELALAVKKLEDTMLDVTDFGAVEQERLFDVFSASTYADGEYLYGKTMAVLEQLELELEPTEPK